MMPLPEFYRMSKQKHDHKEMGKFEGLDNGLNETRTRFVSSSHDEDLMMMPSPENDSESNANQHATCGGISCIPSSSTIVNFSHFAKPVAIVKANLHKIGLCSSKSESVGVKNNRADLNYLEPESQDADVSTPACKEDVSMVDRTSNQVLGESGRNGQEDVENCTKPAEVSSSVSSETGAYRSSDYLNQNLKGKNIYSEDFHWHSHSEDESVGIKRKARGRGGFGSKRNRSAEVHNLSEKKRRDAINEKMRTLQELIPNCNKVDKVSMLDDAIEYLKTLQLQLQIMSMRGGGLYTPMMLPAGMQHMNMPPFSPMGVAMQMGSGAGPNPLMFGLPGHGLHMPMPCAPMFSFPVPNVNSQVMQNINECNSANPMSIQCEATIGHVSSTNEKEAFTLTLGNGDNPAIDKSKE